MVRNIVLTILLSFAVCSMANSGDIHKNQNTVWPGVLGSVVAVPIMIAAGALLANPHWTAINEIPSDARRHYVENSISPMTIPISALAGALGTIPLLISYLRVRDE
jgi:hypothetical protein